MKRLLLAAAVAFSSAGALAQTSGTSSIRIPDGADKALGSTTDNKWGGVGAGSAISVLKGIYDQAIPLGTAGNPNPNAVLTIQGVSSGLPILVGSGLNTPIGSISAAPVLQGSVSTAEPAYNSGNTNALSLKPNGSLRVDVTAGSIAGIGEPSDSAYAGSGNTSVVGALKGLYGLAMEVGTPGSPSTAAVMSVQGVSGGVGLKVGDGPGTSISGIQGPLVQGVVTSGAPGYSSGTINALSLDEAGNLRVAGSFGGTAQGATSAGAQGPMVQSVTSAAAPTYSNSTINPLSTDAQGNLRTAAAGGDVCQRRPHTFTPISTTANAQLVALTSSKRTYVCGLMLIANAAETVSIVTGTGTTCATGTAGMIGGATASIQLAANAGFALGNGGFAMAESASGGAVCLFKAGSVQVSGVIVTAVEP